MTIPFGYFSEETMQNMKPWNATSNLRLCRSIEVMLACKLTLTYGKYSQMMDLQSLVISEETETYEHAEVMADLLNQMAPWQITSPSDLMHTQDEYVDEAISMYKEYKHYLELFEGDCFVPQVVDRFCKKVYEADDYYTFKAFGNLYYSVYAEILLLYQFGKIDYHIFVEQFQEISLFEGKRKPLDSKKLKLYIRTMRKIVNLYISLLCNDSLQRAGEMVG